MQTTRLTERLKWTISKLEQRKVEEEKLLKEQVAVTYESLNPINILQKTLRELTAPSALKDNLIDTTVSILTGYLSRKILIRSSTNLFVRFAGDFAQYSVTNYVARNSEEIRKTIVHLLNRLFDRFKNEKAS